MKTGIEIIMGRPGIGKTTYLALMAKKSLKSKIPVYSNVDIAGCHILSVKEDLMKYHIEEALVIIDEAGKEFNARDFRKFTDKLYEFFTLHRHYKLRVLLAVQFWDRLDIVIRELVQKIYILQPSIIGRWFVKIQEVGVEITVDDETHTIIEKFYRIHPFAGGVHYKLRSPAYPLFNTYDRKKLENKNFEKWSDYEYKNIIIKITYKLKMIFNDVIRISWLQLSRIRNNVLRK